MTFKECRNGVIIDTITVISMVEEENGVTTTPADGEMSQGDSTPTQYNKHCKWVCLHYLCKKNQ